MKESLEEKIQSIINEHLKGSHLWLESITQNKLHIEIIADGWCGINLNECAAISRVVHQKLEEQGIDTGIYLVDVLSPGIEKPIVTPKDFCLNVGRRLQLRNKQNKFVKGYLAFVDKDNIILRTGGGFKEKFENFKIQEVKETITII